MFKKSIDSILKRANKIVQDLNDVADTCESESLMLADDIDRLEHKRQSVAAEASRAKQLAQKWSELV